MLDIIIQQKRKLYSLLEKQLDTYIYREEMFGDDYGKEKVLTIKRMQELLDTIQENILKDMKTKEIEKIVEENPEDKKDLTLLLSTIMK